MPAQTTSGFKTDDYLMVALAVIIGCGLLYAIILAVKTPSPFVKGNWSTLIENFQASPKEFYVSVERAIASVATRKSCGPGFSSFVAMAEI